MGSLNLPIPSDIPTLSLSDSVGKWAGIENQQRQADLNAIQEKRLGQQAEQEGKVNEIKFNALQRAAHNEILTAFKTELQKKAQMDGIQPNTPEYQKLANATYASRYDKLMQNAGIPAFQPGTDIDLAHVETVMTPDEEHARIMEQEQAKQKAMFGREKMLLDYGNQYKDKADERNHQQLIESIDRKHGYDTGDMLLEHKLKIAELETKGNEPKPMNEYQQAKLQEDHDKLESDASSALSQIKTSRANLERLKTLQDNVTTGKFSGNPLISGARVIAGDKELEELEKGYAKASLEAIGALKAGGTTLGALSEKEGAWVRRANMSIENTGKVNKALLDEGINLLNEREKTITNTLGMHRKSFNRIMTGGKYEPMEMPVIEDARTEKPTYNLSTATQKKPDNVSPEKWQKYLESIGAK